MHPMSQGRALIMRYSCSRLRKESITLLVGGAEVVLNCFDDISLDVFLLLEGDCSPCGELPVLVESDSCS